MNAATMPHRPAIFALLALVLILSACGLLIANEDPTLTAIDDQQVVRNTVTPNEVAVAFAVEDDDGDDVTVTATSEHQEVVADGQLAPNCDGDGACTLTFTPFAQQPGETTITVIADDGRGGTDTSSFLVALVPGVFVTNLDDDGPGSLRQAVADAVPGVVIGFDDQAGAFQAQDLTGTIALTEQILIDETLTLEGPGANVLTVSGSNLDRVFSVGTLEESMAIEVVISDLTLSDGVGRIEPTPGASLAGAVLSGVGVDLTFRNSVVENSSDDFAGGGIVSVSFLTLDNTVVQGNTTVNGVGGGIYHDPGLVNDPPDPGFLLVTGGSVIADNLADRGGGLGVSNGDALIEQGSRIIGNQGSQFGGGLLVFEAAVTIDASFVGGLNSDEGNTGNEGGGIYLAEPSLGTAPTLTLQNGSEVAGNVAGDGGGIYNFGPVTIDSGSRVIGNSVSGGSGGGIYNFDSLTIANADIGGLASGEGNEAFSGGGIYNEPGATTILNTGARILGNQATVGGGFTLSAGTLTATGATFDGNSAVDNGGGLRLFAGSATLTDTVIGGEMGNQAVLGGGILSTVDLDLDGVSVSGNSAELGGGIYQGGNVLNITNDSLIENNVAEGGGGLLLDAIVAADIRSSTLRGNQATGGNADPGLGGAVLVLGTSNLFVDDVRFENNTAFAQGGALHITDNAVLDIFDGFFTGNSAGSGGALSLFSSGLAQVITSSFDDNVADEAGAIFHGPGFLNIQTSTFSNNQADSSGALLIQGEIEIFGSTFSNNSATTSIAGAIRNEGGDLTMTSSTLTGNSAATAGGALHLEGGTADLTDVTIGGTDAADANTAELGAGVYAQQAGGTFTDIDLLGNVASLDGGGLFADESTLNVNGLIEGNFAARDGGGVVVLREGPVVFGDLHITNNTADGNGGGVYSDTRQIDFSGVLLIDFNKAGGDGSGWLGISPVFFNFDPNDPNVSFDVIDNTPNDIFIFIP